MHELLKRIEEERVVGIIRTETTEQAFNAALAAIRGGLKMVEITLTVPDAYSVIGDLAKNKDILVCAGTVLNADMAELAIESGARWIISPHTDPEIITYCKSHHICVSGGALTPNEIYNSWNIGSDIVKVYPIQSVGGPRHIRSILEPLSFMKLMPSGTVYADNVLEYLEAGAVAVGVGSSIFNKEAIQTAQFNVISERTSRLLHTLKAWYEKR